MIQSESDDDLSEKEDENSKDVVNSQDDYSPGPDVERISNASGSVIINSHSRLSIDRGIDFALLLSDA